MNSTRAIASYCVLVACAVACATVLAMLSPQRETISELGGAASGAAYLDCAHISGSVLEPDLVTVCSMVASVAPQRDFESPADTSPTR